MKEKSLPPQIAARLFTEDPDKIRIMLPDLLRGFGLTMADIGPDLISGRLAATIDGEPDSQEAFDELLNGGKIWVRGSALLRWLAGYGYGLKPKAGGHGLN